MACKAFKEEGAKKAVPLAIGGSFHSPYMEEAKFELGEIIKSTLFRVPKIPICQCVDAKIHTDPEIIKMNLIEHITHPVLWTSMIENIEKENVQEYYEVGTDDTLQKIVKRMCPQKKVISLLDINKYHGIINNYSL